MRNLTTCEKRGTIIKHELIGTIATIVGSYVGGFVVACKEDGVRRMLPFTITDDYVVIEEGQDKSFEAWMRDVDREIEKLSGMTSADLPDALYRDAYDKGVKAVVMAKRVYREAKKEYGG